MLVFKIQNAPKEQAGKLRKQNFSVKETGKNGQTLIVAAKYVGAGSYDLPYGLKGTVLLQVYEVATEEKATVITGFNGEKLMPWRESNGQASFSVPGAILVSVTKSQDPHVQITQFAIEHEGAYAQLKTHIFWDEPYSDFVEYGPQEFAAAVEAAVNKQVGDDHAAYTVQRSKNRR